MWSAFLLISKRYALGVNILLVNDPFLSFASFIPAFILLGWTCKVRKAQNLEANPKNNLLWNMFSVLRKSAQLQEVLFKYVCARCQQRLKVSGGVSSNRSARSSSKSIVRVSRPAGAILLTGAAHCVGICRTLLVAGQFKDNRVCEAEPETEALRPDRSG